jgi:hypothetical protein
MLWCDLEVGGVIYYCDFNMNSPEEFPKELKILSIEKGEENFLILLEGLDDIIELPFKQYFTQNNGTDFSGDVTAFHVIAADVDGFWEQFNSIRDAVKDFKDFITE